MTGAFFDVLNIEHTRKKCGYAWPALSEGGQSNGRDRAGSGQASSRYRVPAFWTGKETGLSY